MKKIIFPIILLTLILASNLYSQTFGWEPLSNPLDAGPQDRFNDVYFLNQDTGWTVHYTRGMAYRTINGGETWDSSNVYFALRSIGFFDYENGIAGTLNDDTTKLLFRTTNHGVNWTVVNDFQNPRPRGICGIYIVNSTTAYATGKFNGTARVIKTLDKGLTWTSPVIDTSMARSLVDCYFWNKDTGIICGGYRGNSVVLKTEDGGNSWRRVYRSTTTTEQCWKISCNGGSIGFLSIEKLAGMTNILKFTDYGEKWETIPFMTYHQQGIGFLNEDVIWVGGHGGPTYESTNGGAEWHLAGWGQLVNRIRFLNDTLGFAAAEKIYKYTRIKVGITNLNTGNPGSFELSQNYPNPFNPITKIKFAIPKSSHVSLIIYDQLGKIIQTLVNERLDAGSFEYSFSTVNLSSGIYFYRMHAGDFNQTRKMILLK